MKALFAHDNRFHKYDNSYFSTGLNASVFQRYLKVFDSLIICGREVQHLSTDSPKGTLASIPNVVEFCNVKDKNAIAIWFNKKDRALIESLVRKVNFVIVRLDSIIGFIALKYARKYNIPYVIELCTDPWDCYVNYGMKGKILAPFITRKTKIEVRRAKNVIYVTNRYLQEKYPCNNNIISISNVDCIPKEDIAQIKLEKYLKFNKKDPIVLGTAGALLPFKGQRFVIEALKKLRDKGISNIFYKMAGEGSDRDSLFKIVKKYGLEDYIEFCGSLNSSEMDLFYQSLDIYIQPSLQEGLPRTVIEAMSRGIFCLGARTAGIPELISENCIFEKRAVDEIVSILENLSIDKLIREAKKNFYESKKYSSDVLEKKRTVFFLNVIGLMRNK